MLDPLLNTDILLLNPHKRDAYYLYFTDEKTQTQSNQEMWQGHTASKRWSRICIQKGEESVFVCLITTPGLHPQLCGFPKLHMHLKSDEFASQSSFPPFFLPSLSSFLPNY